jgi:hypothetical protein
MMRFVIFGSLGVRHRDCVRSRDPASSRRSMLAGLHELLRTVIPINRITNASRRAL